MPLLKTYKWMIALTMINDIKSTPKQTTTRLQDPEDAKWETRITLLPNGKIQERL